MKMKKLMISILFLGLFILPEIISLKNGVPFIENQDNSPKLPTTQSNYTPLQTQLYPYIWKTLNLSGDTNASIAIIGTGIDESHIKFGYDSYADKEFSKKIVGWHDFTPDSASEPLDPNGQDTLISSILCGDNSTESDLILDSQGRISVTLGGQFYHPNLFEQWMTKGFFNLKLGSFNVSTVNSNISIKGTFNELDGTNYIAAQNQASFKILRNSNTVATTSLINPSVYESAEYNITLNTGLYDIIFQYYLGFNNPANFTVNAFVNFTLDPIENQVKLSGISPNGKIVSLRTLNEEKKGETNELINALNWIDSHAEEYQIIATTISIGDYDGVGLLNEAIDSLISKGIMVFIAAGDSGIELNALNEVAKNKKAIVVGSVNEYNQLTYYSSQGQNIDSQIYKPDILAPGGSRLLGYRSIIGADSNDNDVMGYYTEGQKNDTTMTTGTSISAGILASMYNLLVEVFGNYDDWKLIMNEQMALNLKAILLMTASETNKLREDNPYTSINEGASSTSPILNRGSKDIHEGYGIVNLDAAVDALNKSMLVGTVESDIIVSSLVNPAGKHVFARKITLEQNKNYLFNLTHFSSSDVDLYLYKNTSDSYGEPILLRSSVQSGNSNESFIFGTTNDTNDYVIVVKSVSGGLVNFNLEVTEMQNIWAPSLSNIYVNGTQGFNDTLDIIEFRINYTDPDNLPPILIYVNINDTLLSSNLTLIKQNPSDNNYLDGCIYVGYHRFYIAGDYEYHFGTFDGNNFTRIPTDSNLTITIVPISNAYSTEYRTIFTDTTGWTLSTNWGRYSQQSSLDDRGLDYPSNWNLLYFGNSQSVLSGSYNYTGISAGTYSALSPQILIENTNIATLSVGQRVSINSGDSYYIEIRVNRTGSWNTLQSFTNIEQDWTYCRYNLSQYSGQYIQIRLRVVLNQQIDLIQNKGIMITDFKIAAIEDPNNYEPELLNITVTPERGSKYGSYQFSFYYCDQDETVPQNVFLELNGINRTMVNLYGDWNSSFIKIEDNLSSGGIFYFYNVCLATITNPTFRIHVKSNNIWYNSSYIAGPIFEIVSSIYPFLNNNSLMTVYGNPEPLIKTKWVSSENSFHFIEQNNTWYAGAYNFQGYGLNWNVNLVTPTIYIPTTDEEAYRIVLVFTHRLIFDPTNPLFDDEAASVYISDNDGSTWSLLKTYLSGTNIQSYEEVRINLNNYRGKNVIIRFNFRSDNILLGSAAGSGWYLQNITINYDETEDRIAPTIIFHELQPNDVISGIYKLNITLTDNLAGVDDKRTSVYIGLRKIQGLISNNGIISYNLDTTLYKNGEYVITIFAYDKVGNSARLTVTVRIYNPIQINEMLPWVLVCIIGFLSLTLITYYYHKKRKEEDEIYRRLFNNPKDENIENIDATRDLIQTHAQRKALEKSQRKILELKIREDAENATKSSEDAKPFLLFCKNCKKWFQSWEFEWMCPACQHDSLFIGYQCKLCGKWYFKDGPGSYYCNKRNCKIKLLK